MVEDSGDFKKKIRDLRVATEKVVESLKKFEVSGTESDATSALWVASAIWNGEEYGNIESSLRAKGHRSVLDRIVEKGGDNEKTNK